MIAAAASSPACARLAAPTRGTTRSPQTQGKSRLGDGGFARDRVARRSIAARWTGRDRRHASTVVRADASESSKPKPNGVYERFQQGISDEEREAVRQSWDKVMRWSRRVEEKNSKKEDVLATTKKVAVMGGGSFGTAMATLLARNKADLDVVILVRSEADAESINEDHKNAKYLPKYELPTNIRATTDPAHALPGSDFIVHAVPVQSSKAFLAGGKQHIAPETPLLCLSKGLDRETCEMMSEVIPEGIGRKQPLAVLSGPTFAVELMQGLPTAIVAASEDKNLAWRVQRLFASTHLRVNTSADVVGVEMSGALKNVLAIAAGMIEGLSLGNNALASVVAQGCAEIRWLASKMGARPETLAGLSGTGDIMLTCFVNLSRNRTVGVRLGKGESLEDILGSMNQVAEGVATAGAVMKLARRYKVSLPVLTAVARILEDDLDPRDAVEEIMNLPQVPEV